MSENEELKAEEVKRSQKKIVGRSGNYRGPAGGGEESALGVRVLGPVPRIIRMRILGIKVDMDVALQDFADRGLTECLQGSHSQRQHRLNSNGVSDSLT